MPEVAIHEHGHLPPGKYGVGRALGDTAVETKAKPERMHRTAELQLGPDVPRDSVSEMGTFLGRSELGGCGSLVAVMAALISRWSAIPALTTGSTHRCVPRVKSGRILAVWLPFTEPADQYPGHIMTLHGHSCDTAACGLWLVATSPEG
jgi:hypothetical protein